MTVQDTLNERGARYGDFTVHAGIAQGLQDVMRGSQGWQRLDAVKRQALTVIADKIARVLSGDPHYIDSWHDIQGYARLVEERLATSDSEPVIRCGICGDVECLSTDPNCGICTRSMHP